MKYTIGRFDIDITKHDEKVTLTIGGVNGITVIKTYPALSYLN